MSAPVWLKGLAQFLVPYAIYVRLAKLKSAGLTDDQNGTPAYLAANAALRRIHAGKRAFVVGNGPSINRQDLRHLKGEIVFTMSNGYRHPHYLEVGPQYHCVPQISSAAKMTDEHKCSWLREIERSTGRAEIFLSDTERMLVSREGLFADRRVRYLRLTGDFDKAPTESIIDISRGTPSVQSAPIMCLMIAMYMGVDRIYLLGIEHDHFLTGRYEYFFEPGLLRGVDPQVSVDGTTTLSRYDEFEALHRLWRQYRALRLIGEANEIHIFNATDGGALDEFPRVRYESLFR